MKTLPLVDWIFPALTTAATLLCLWRPRKPLLKPVAECGHPLPLARYRPEPPSDEWCPAHDTWHAGDEECPGCREEWEQTWTLGEDPAELARRDDWNDQEMEAAAAAFEPAEDTDGWYRDLAGRAALGQDPHAGWRDGPDFEAWFFGKKG